MNPDSTLAIYHIVPRKRILGWSRIDLPQGPEVASVTGAEESPIHHIHETAQMSTFQANGSDLLFRPQDGDFVFRIRTCALGRESVQRIHRNPSVGRKPARRSPYILKYPGETHSHCPEARIKYSLENKFPSIQLTCLPLLGYRITPESYLRETKPIPKRSSWRTDPYPYPALHRRSPRQSDRP